MIYSSASTAVLGVLRAHPEGLTFREISEALPDIKPATVRTAIARLLRRKELTTCGHVRRAGHMQHEIVYRPLNEHQTGRQIAIERAALMRRLHHITDAASLATLRIIITTIEDMQ